MRRKMAMALYNKYEKLERLQLSESNLRRYNYPRSHPTTPGKAEMTNDLNHYTLILNQQSRVCRRCNATYSVQRDGRVVIPDQCSYHPYRRPNKGKSYRCCYGTSTAKPCKTAPQHVHENIDVNHLTGFILTKDNTDVMTKAAYAMDCEMIYTDGGIEVAALSVVDSNCDVVYETQVVPDHPILDYNTEFSCLKASDFDGVTTTLKDVHTKFLSLFGPNTILVGHGLANDLLRLRVIHDRVLDTLHVYPHKKGFPFCNSLQYLKDHFLPYDRIISGGYKCRGDAIATMNLVLRKA